MKDKTGIHELESAGEIQKTASGYRASRILLSAFDLGVFTALGGGRRSSGEIAREIGADPRAADRLMNALCAVGLLRKNQGLFENTPAGLKFLVKGSKDYMAGLGHTSRIYQSWGTLTEAVRAGGRVHKTPMEDREWTGKFIEAMHWRAGGRAGELAGLLDLEGVNRLLDVGGGSGVFSMAFCRAKRSLSAVVFDLPTVTPLTERYVAEAGLTDRISTVSGDYRSDEFGQDFDMVLFSAIMHINSPETNKELLAKAARALNPGGRIVISDFFVEPDRIGPAGAVLFAINMLVNTEAGDTYTVDEMTGWLKAAGCSEVSHQRTGPDTGLLVGRPA